MSGSQILRDKHAVVFGAGRSFGAAVAKEFAAEGAEVFLSGRTKSNLEAVAKRIGEHGVRAQAALIDTLNDSAVNEYFDGIVKRSGKIDIILDAAGLSPKTTETVRTLWIYRLKSSWCRSRRL